MTARDISLDALVETKGVVGAYEVDTDGFLLGSIDAGVEDKEAIAAVAAVAQITSERIGEVLRLGALAWIVLEYESGKLILARRGTKIWAIVTNGHALLGEILMRLKYGAETS